MKNNVESIASSMTVAEIANKVRLLAGVVTMALGLVMFILWFGWSLTSYVGNVGHHESAPRSVIVASE